MVAAPTDYSGALCSPVRFDLIGASDGKQPHELWLHLLQNQDQKSPCHSLYTHTPQPPMEIPTPKLPQPLRGVRRNKKQEVQTAFDTSTSFKL